MVTRASALLLLGVLFACTPGEGGIPAAPGPSPTSSPASGDPARVDRAVRDFLDAFAAGAEDPGSLRRAVWGPLLEDWADWVGLGEPGSEASRSGSVDVRALRVVGIEGDVARAELDATVTLGLVGPEGRAAQEERLFRGPVALVRDPDASAGWAVSDLVREGRPMSLAITVFTGDAVGAGGGVEVEVRSLYRFESGTVANLRITNGAARPFRMDRPSSLVQAAGRFVGATAAPRRLLDPIAPGASVDGSVSFHAMPLAWLPEKVMLHHADGASVTVDLPEEAFIPRTSEA